VVGGLRTKQLSKDEGNGCHRARPIRCQALQLALAILANGQPVKDHVLPLQNGTLSFQTWFQRRGSAIKSQFVTGAPLGSCERWQPPPRPPLRNSPPWQPRKHHPNLT